ncbi:hypothetical protein ACJX0J_019435, partial [Zea mays]
MPGDCLFVDTLPIACSFHFHDLSIPFLLIDSGKRGILDTSSDRKFNKYIPFTIW